MRKREKQEGIKDLKIKEGSFVRYILPRTNEKAKKRFQYSWECFKISSVKGNIYTLMAKDGTVLNLPRFKLLLMNKDGKKPKNIKWANTIPDRWNGEISKIISFNKRTNKYKVLFKVPGKEDYIDEIPSTYLRGNYPQKISDIEKEFTKNQET